MKPSKYHLGRHLEASLTERVDQLFAGENTTETILHAHLLIERAITNKISDKLKRPKILEEVQWSFYQKYSLYVGLFDPPEDQARRLKGFNQLRNSIAHALEVDIEAAVKRCLPIEKERPEDEEVIPSNALAHVRLVAGMILMFDLGAIIGWSLDPIDWDQADLFFGRMREKFEIDDPASDDSSNSN